MAEGREVTEMSPGFWRGKNKYLTGLDLMGGYLFTRRSTPASRLFPTFTKKILRQIIAADLIVHLSTRHKVLLDHLLEYRNKYYDLRESHTKEVVKVM